MNYIPVFSVSLPSIDIDYFYSLVLDRDVNEDLALLYPELYKDLVKGRSLSYKTFFEWLMISVYQGFSICPKVMSWVVADQGYDVRWSNHDDVSIPFRKRVPQHCGYLIYCPCAQRAYNGSFGNQYLVCQISCSKDPLA